MTVRLIALLSKNYIIVSERSIYFKDGVKDFSINIVLAFYKLQLFKVTRGQEKNTLVSGNAGDEKNLHPGSRNLFFNKCNK